MKIHRLRAAGCLTLLAALAAPAANIGMDIPYANFTDRDREIFHETLDAALAKGADGVAVSWTNPESKARGRITPLKAFERGGMQCRKATIENHAKGRSASGPFNLCKDAAGKWLIAK